MTMARTVLALARLVCPDANIPSTTALETVDANAGYELGLRCGANVVMPNVTPAAYRALYDIYPDKACARDDPSTARDQLIHRLQAEGRRMGVGRGDSPRYRRRMRRGAADEVT